MAVLLWFAFGSWVLAIAGGLEEHPFRRALIGVVLVSAYAIAVVRRRDVCAALRAWPSAVLVIAAVELAAAAADGALDSPYSAFALTSIGLAAVAAQARTVWLCVALLVIGYGAAATWGRTPAELARDSDLGVALGLMVSAPVAAALMLGLRWLLMRFDSGADGMVQAWRAGVPALSPGLTRAIAGPDEPPLLAPGRPPSAGLTPAEVRIVEGLADGRSAKQLALDHGVALSTVRTHIRNAKRKSGARTLRELAGTAAHPDWPDIPAARR